MTRDSYIIPPKKAETIIREAISLADHTHTDQLDCSVSVMRQNTDKTVDDILKLAKKSTFVMWNFTLRPNPVMRNEKPYADVGCCVEWKHVTYFIWIHLDIVHAQTLIKKYKLKLR